MLKHQSPSTLIHCTKRETGRRQYLNTSLVKSYMWQLMKSLDHMHKKGIFHRDIKPENILIESATEVAKGLKLADLGSCRGIYSKQPYTEYISTRWYRAPECLLTDGYYGPEMVRAEREAEGVLIMFCFVLLFCFVLFSSALICSLLISSDLF